MKCSKCEFGKTQLEYLGHIVDEHGIHPVEDIENAIQEATVHTNVKEFQAFFLSFSASASICKTL